MAVVVEVNDSLLEHAAEAAGIAEPAALVQRGLEQLIRLAAYRTYLADQEIEMNEDEIASTVHLPFYTVEIYTPALEKEWRNVEEKKPAVAVALSRIRADDSLTDEEKQRRCTLIEMGGSEPDATAPPRRRFW